MGLSSNWIDFVFIEKSRFEEVEIYSFVMNFTEKKWRPTSHVMSLSWIISVNNRKRYYKSNTISTSI